MYFAHPFLSEEVRDKAGDDYGNGVVVLKVWAVRHRRYGERRLDVHPLHDSVRGGF